MTRSHRPYGAVCLSADPQPGHGPILTQLAQWLEDDALFQRFKADLLRRAPHTPPAGGLPYP